MNSQSNKIRAHYYRNDFLYILYHRIHKGFSNLFSITINTKRLPKIFINAFNIFNYRHLYWFYYFFFVFIVFYRTNCIFIFIFFLILICIISYYIFFIVIIYYWLYNYKRTIVNFI